MVISRIGLQWDNLAIVRSIWKFASNLLGSAAKADGSGQDAGESLGYRCGTGFEAMVSRL